MFHRHFLRRVSYLTFLGCRVTPFKSLVVPFVEFRVLQVGGQGCELSFGRGCPDQISGMRSLLRVGVITPVEGETVIESIFYEDEFELLHESRPKDLTVLLTSVWRVSSL